MSKLSGAFKFSRRHIIVDEANVIVILDAINRQRCCNSQDLRVGNCGWASDPSKWYVAFTASDKKWMRIIDEMNAKGYQFIIKGPKSEVYMV